MSGRTRADKLDLGVLDYCVRAAGASSEQALATTVRLAAEAERWGYSRFWLTEHHHRYSGHAAPEMLLPTIAMRTRRIRLGTGGLLLRYASPIKVVETFRTLEAIFPGRFELGVARAPAAKEKAINDALLYDERATDAFPISEDERYRRRVADLVALLRGGFPPGHPHADAVVAPLGVPSPPLWLLGSKVETAELAARHGAPLSYALFYNGNDPAGPATVAQRYRAKFEPSPQQLAPSLSIALKVLCARTSAKAARIAEEGTLAGYGPYQVVGSPDECVAQLRALASAYETRQVVVATPHADAGIVRESFGLLATANAGVVA